MLCFMFEVTQTVTTLLMSTSLILTNNDDDDEHNDSYQDRPHLKQLKDNFYIITQELYL